MAPCMPSPAPAWECAGADPGEPGIVSVDDNSRDRGPSDSWDKVHRGSSRKLYIN